MRVFIRHNHTGEIVSVTKVTVMAENLEHPYGDLSEGDSVLEVTPTDELEALDCHEFGDRYVVDLSGKTLTPKGERQPPKRPRR